MRNSLAAGLIVLISFLVVQNHVSAAVKLPRLVSNGMVLQRDVPIKIWGWAILRKKLSYNLKEKLILSGQVRKGTGSLNCRDGCRWPFHYESE
jgi:sialate O-acetylesterase